LHAQRLVPDSCASIQSAVSSDKEWKLVTAVVDTDQDRVQCFSRDGIPKSSPSESGTSISILVPVRLFVNIVRKHFPSFSLSPRFGPILGRFKRYQSLASFGRIFCTLQTVVRYDV
jgi:hypothetical protein